MPPWFDVASNAAGKIITILTLLSLIIAIVKNPVKAIKIYNEEQKAEKESIKKSEERLNLLEPIVKGFSDALPALLETKSRLDKLEPTMETMSKNIEGLLDHQKESDRSRLRFHIVDFVNALKAGEERSEVQFEYILQECREYGELNGNGYVGKDYIELINEAHKKKLAKKKPSTSRPRTNKKVAEI